MLFIGFTMFVFSLWFVSEIFRRNDAIGTDKVIIAQGWGVNEVSRALSDKNVIRSPFVFETLVWLLRAERKLEAGAYRIPEKSSILSIARMIMKGKGSENENALTVIEGWTSDQIADLVEQKTDVSKQDFLDIVLGKTEDDFSSFSFLLDRPPAGLTLEGYLFPDTYRVFTDASALDIVSKLLKNFDRRFSSGMREDARAQGKTIFEIVTTASIIEREVKTSEDKKLAADVFWKRLLKGIPLQSDATVNYATGKAKTRPSGEDLSVDSPYNTYLFKGLPPGPISNPGLDSLLAALYPKKNEFYYFLTKEDGEAVFSKTKEEHDENKRKFLD